eukprot:3932988-Prymnesium_polylepis.1
MCAHYVAACVVAVGLLSVMLSWDARAGRPMEDGRSSPPAPSEAAPDPAPARSPPRQRVQQGILP